MKLLTIFIECTLKFYGPFYRHRSVQLPVMTPCAQVTGVMVGPAKEVVAMPVKAVFLTARNIFDIVTPEYLFGMYKMIPMVVPRRIFPIILRLPFSSSVPVDHRIHEQYPESVESASETGSQEADSPSVTYVIYKDNKLTPDSGSTEHKTVVVGNYDGLLEVQKSIQLYDKDFKFDLLSTGSLSQSSIGLSNFTGLSNQSYEPQSSSKESLNNDSFPKFYFVKQS